MKRRRALRALALAPILVATAGLAGEKTPMFTLREEHLRVLRQAIVMWAPIESGVPGVMVSPALIHEEMDLRRDLVARAELAWSDPPTAEQRQAVERLFEEMPQAFAQLLEHGKLAPGSYAYANPLAGIPHVENMLPAELAALAKDRTGNIAISREHLTLLRAARWQALFMNPKRPYGDMTYFERDMAEILGMHVQDGPGGRLAKGDEERLFRLHVELLPALQVYLQKATIAPGEYPPLPVEAMPFGSRP